jgi:hypothetical protein
MEWVCTLLGGFIKWEENMNNFLKINNKIKILHYQEDQGKK